MEGKPRPTPGLLKTLETIMTVVRQSRESETSPPQEKVEVNELLDLFKSDLSRDPSQVRRAEPTPVRAVRVQTEEQEAEALARIRAALYSSK
ncbi:hypothetical protein OG2516_06092 [Oceanicola granulosus HTCC2516]|uniref:Uncharacterized protein n=2 Tax=Oceanicola granulosus TaxID=252302 RepID=Q2CDE6_OCEGH|nr:hypothetical protein OG2516_06092 [Oceanicola granulosus HTCC2516]